MACRVHRRARGKAAGFTLVEMLVVMAISVIGFLALVHLQTANLRGATNAWEMVAATHLGQHLLETIRMEAIEWTNDTTQPYTQAKFQYLRFAPSPAAAGATSGWRRAFGNSDAFQMVNQAGRLLGVSAPLPEYDAGIINGSDFADPSSSTFGELPDNRNQRFCVQYRLTWLIPNTLLRAEARVMWPVQEGRGGRYDSCPAGMENDTVDVYQLTFTTTVMRNVFVSP